MGDAVGSTVFVDVRVGGSVGLCVTAVGDKVCGDVLSIVVGSDDGGVGDSMVACMNVVGGIVGESVSLIVLSMTAAVVSRRLRFLLVLLLVCVVCWLCNCNCNEGVVVGERSSWRSVQS